MEKVTKFISLCILVFFGLPAFAQKITAIVNPANPCVEFIKNISNCGSQECKFKAVENGQDVDYSFKLTKLENSCKLDASLSTKNKNILVSRNITSIEKNNLSSFLKALTLGKNFIYEFKKDCCPAQPTKNKFCSVKNDTGSLLYLLVDENGAYACLPRPLKPVASTIVTSEVVPTTLLQPQINLQNATVTQTGPNSIDIQSTGNLKTTQDLGCLEEAAFRNQYTPADLIHGSAVCANQKEYDKANKMMFVASAYGFYDQARVADKSAHQALTVIKMNVADNLTPEQLRELEKSMTKLKADPTVCDLLKKLGPPDYHPSYMIQHGMQAFVQQKPGYDGLVKPFDSASAWNAVLAGGNCQ